MVDMDRWAINIDIEGFSQTYDSDPQAMVSLRALMDGIFKIGSECYPNSPERIFAHQLGDGFLIVGEFGSEKLQKPVAIAAVLMQHVLANGGAAKASISEGDFADIQGCYPESIRRANSRNGTVFMGEGLMTTFSVMGTALINAFKLSGKAPSGSLLVTHEAYSDRLPEEVNATTISKQKLISIDWIHSDFPISDDIQSQTDLGKPEVSELESGMRRYIDENSLRLEWKSNTQVLLNI